MDWGLKETEPKKRQCLFSLCEYRGAAVKVDQCFIFLFFEDLQMIRNRAMNEERGNLNMSTLTSKH